MRFLFLSAVISSIAFSSSLLADPVGVQQVSPSSEYEQPHDDYAFGTLGPRMTLRGKPAFWVRMDTPADSSGGSGSSAQRSPAPSSSAGKELSAASVFFATGSARPLDAGILDFLKRSDSAEIAVTGRADSAGSVPFNKSLSQKRAESVASYLEKNGISSSRIRVFAKGESDPVASNATSDGRARNRQVRVEVKDK